MEINKKLEKFIIYAIEIIFILILSFLTVESIFKTCTMDIKEVTSYLNDNPIIHIITISATICIFMLINKKKIKIDKKILWILIEIWVLISVIWIYVCDLYPRADQKYIYEIASQMRQGNFKGFNLGKYAYSNPHQYGLILYEFIFGFIFGSRNYLGLQLINVVALLVAFFCIYKITRKMFENKQTSVGTIIGLLLFVPIWSYITFIYGNIIGFSLSMIAMLFAINYIETGKIRFICISSICVGLAAILKSNYLIMLIAIVCILILDMISRKKLKNIISILILLIAYVSLQTITTFTVETISGKEKQDGIPMLAYVEMGLQEGRRAPGWYNGYNRNIYKKNQYNSEKAKDDIKEDLSKTITKLKDNPNYTVEFWINNSRITGTGKEKPAIVKSINGYGKVNKVIFECMNITQSIILFGATIFMLTNFKKNNIKQLIFAVMFIGGFLFHLIWEAKCQYTITYFVLLIPYSIRGYIQLSDTINKKIKMKN